MISPAEGATGTPNQPRSTRRPSDLRIVSAFLLALSALLAGYMFLGRGLAHVGRPPIYVGEIVLFVGLIATAVAFVRLRLRPRLMPVVWLLLGFMVLGLIRTVPYLGVYGVDALRDGVLWGYAIFALMIYVLADRAEVLGAFRLYGWIVPVFALWLPISYSVFAAMSAGIQASEIGSDVPIVFFKGGDMAVHIVGCLAFLVLGAGAITRWRTFAWRAAIAIPILWIALVASAANRGALITIIGGVAAIAVFAILFRRSRNWAPVLAVPIALALAVGGVGVFSELTGASASSSPTQSSPEPAASCEPVPASPPLAANPGFEVGSLNDGTIEGWATWAGLYNIVGGGGYRGAQYASVQNTGDAWTATITSSRFSILAGHDIVVSLRARAIEGSPAIATYVNWYDSSDALIASVFLTTLETDGHDSWQQSVGAFTAPAGATQADVQLFETTGHSTIGLDEVVAQEPAASCDPAPASRSLVANPGFELGSVNAGRIKGWVTWTGLYNIVGGGGYRGAQYASVQSTGAAWSATITSSRFPIASGHDISVTLWAKAIEGSPRIASYVNWYGSTGDPIASSFLAFLDTDGDDAWQQSVGAVGYPAGATSADVQLFEATGHGTIGLDEVIVHSGQFLASHGRPPTIDQILKNITSIFSSSSDGGLEGSKAFRLKWWGTIINYTVFGQHFWTGKGFGVNLATDDGFQANLDNSLRSPHNSHLTTLARMGVPGFAIWLLLQGAFGIGLLRAVLAYRRAGSPELAAVSAWILVYWVGMMINTSFDPYLEGPQGGIWFWSLFGLGLVVMRLAPRARTA